MPSSQSCYLQARLSPCACLQVMLHVFPRTTLPLWSLTAPFHMHVTNRRQARWSGSQRLQAGPDGLADLLADLDIPDIEGDLATFQEEQGATFTVRLLGVPAIHKQLPLIAFRPLLERLCP